MHMGSPTFLKIGSDVQIWPMAKIVGPESVALGDSIIIDDYAFIVGGEGTTIHSFVHIASFVSITGGGRFTIGSFSGLATGARIVTGTDDFGGGGLAGPTVPNKFRNAKRSFVDIGSHVIVGANTVVLPGVTIGEGATIGASSLVTKDCEPWTVYFGSPARAVRRRPPETIRLLESQLRRELYNDRGEYIPKERR